MAKIVALYVRVSTLEQAEEGYSIAEQTERLKKYCEAMGWLVGKIYTDGGYSGSNINRPAMQALIKDIAAYNAVVVYKLDRLSRSQKDTLYLIEDVFSAHGVGFISMSENFDTATPFGKAMIGILSVFAQLEREQIKERMMMGRIGGAKQGHWRGGSGIPIGYTYTKGDNILKIDEYEAVQIREVFKLYLEGMPCHAICRHLKNLGYTNKYSGWNDSHTIQKIVSNPTYIGKIRYAGQEYDGGHEPIIDEETFRAAQIEYNRRQATITDAQRVAWRGKYLLSGIIYCGLCGARYFVHSGGRKPSYMRYTCYSRDGNKDMKKVDGCKGPRIKVPELNNQIITEILKLNIDNIKPKKKTEDNTEVIRKRLAVIDKEINRLLDLYQLGTLSISSIQDRVLPLEEEREKLSAQQTAEKELIDMDEIKEAINSAKDIFENGTEEEKAILVKKLIRRIDIYPEKINITWAFD